MKTPITRTMSVPWEKQAKDVERSKEELPRDSISRSGRVRKIKDMSQNYIVGSDMEGRLLTSIAKSDKVIKVTKATATTKKLDDPKKVKKVAVNPEAEVAPKTTVEETPQPEAVKEGKPRVDVDLLQKVLTESVEEWFSFTEVVTNSKGKPCKKRRLMLPPLDESDFSFELTETKDTVNTSENGDNRVDSTSVQEPEESQPNSSKTENIELRNNIKKKVKKAVITKESKTTTKSDNKSKKVVNGVVTKEQDERDVMKERPKTTEGNESEKTTENGKNKRLCHVLALMLYGGQTGPETMTPDSKPKRRASRKKAKTVIKAVEAADLKDFEMELGDFWKLPRDSPLFDSSLNEIKRLLQTGANGSGLRKSLSAECLNVFPRHDQERPKRSAEMPAALPSRQRRMNLKTRECFFRLRGDIIEKYKRKAECRMRQEVMKLKEKRSKELKAKGKNKEHVKNAKEEEFRRKGSKQMVVDKVEHKKKPKTNKRVHEKTEREEMNGRMQDEVEAGLETPGMKVVTTTKPTKPAGLMKKKQVGNQKDRKMSGMRLKRRKRVVASRDRFFHYVNKIKRKSERRSRTDGAESPENSYKEPTPQPVNSTQETRVDEEKNTEPKQGTRVEEKSTGMEPKQGTRVEGKPEETTERRKSRREIKLTPKLVDMIATSHKRVRRSPSIREDSVENVIYEYPHLIKTVVNQTVTPEVVETPPPASAAENDLQSKTEANVSYLKSSWKPGDVIWARCAGSPFWPSLVVRDPFSDNVYSKEKHLGRFLKNFVHIQFLADSGRRAWVPEIYCMGFDGLVEFEIKKANLPKIDSFTRRYDVLYQKAFFPSKAMEKSWLDAVKEGEIILPKSREERIAYMMMKYPNVNYAESVTNGGLPSNEQTSDGSKKPESRTGKRNTRSSSCLESSDGPGSEKAPTAEEASTQKNEALECEAGKTEAGDNKEGDGEELPESSLKVAASSKKEEKRKWRKSLESVEGEVTKRPKKEVSKGPHVSGNGVSTSKVASGRPRRSRGVVGSSKGGKGGKVCQVCLRMVESEKVVKCKGACPGSFPNSCRRNLGGEGPSLEEGAGPALNMRKRRRKFSSPRFNRWKQNLWAFIDFYKEFGGSERDGMDVRGLFELYRSLFKNKTGNRRRLARLRKIK